MILIHHRRNSVAELAETPKKWGVEIDLRNHGQDLLVTHDPFITEAVTLETWLDGYDHAFLIANVKEEGMEPRLEAILREREIRDYFILDESFPFIRRYALEGLSRFAVRVSEYEVAETAIRLSAELKKSGRSVDWIWADSFTGQPLDPREALGLRTAGYRFCAVSPELHHIADPASWEQRIAAFREELARPEMKASLPEMVCTKRPDLWMD